MFKRNILLVSSGDPAGIGPEVTMKAMKDFPSLKDLKIIPVGNFEVLSEAAHLVSYEKPLIKIDCPEEFVSDEYTGILNVESIDFEKGFPSAAAGSNTYKILKKCSDLCLEKKATGMITAPINKESLSLAGYGGLGHTEILRNFSNAKYVETIFCIENLKIFFLSRHLSLLEAISEVKKENILKKIFFIDRYMKTIGYENPKIGIPGLNPHCGDGGLFGSEEIDEIIPSVLEARKNNIDAQGPIGADSIYHLGINGNFDAILSLYHDQGHIASKTYNFYHTITMTAGLPYLRTSVDHGTAYNIAWKNVANHESMVRAIKLAVELV